MQTCGGFAAAITLALLAAACKTTSTPAPVAPVATPAIPWEEKIGWIVRLEDQRLIRDPDAPSVTAPGVAQPPSDLIRLLDDREAAVRTRAALALGRVGLREAVAPLTQRLADRQADVRQMAAFALGLLRDTSARPALLAALGDADPIVQGRAAEALALIGDRMDAGPIAAMAQAHVRAGAIAAIEPDDLGYPLSPAAEAVRLGIFAVTRLSSYEALASVVLDASGQPVSAWWPVAYGLQRVNDARAVPALLRLLDTPGRYTASFAAKGLSGRPSSEAAASLRRVVEMQRAPPMVVVQAMRSLAASRVVEAVPTLLKMLGASSTEPIVRAEAMAAFAALAGHQHVDLLLDLLSHGIPSVRAEAARSLARVDPDAFLASLASLDPDAEWTVRAAQAQALGTLPGDRAAARLLAMLGDKDARVIPAVLAALAAANVANAERLVSERLKADDFVVRAAAATALADLKAAGSVPVIVDAYRAATGEETYVARAAMLAAVNRLAPDTARPLLVGALEDRDWAVRVRAAALLKEQRADPSLVPLRPATAGRPVNDPAWRQIVAPPYSPRVYIDTSKGTIELELTVGDAPLTVHNFVTLARKGFFNGAPVHRIVADFVVQDGDPRGDGEGGPGYTIRDEINERPYLRGTLGMALDWEDTGGSQFFITHSPQPHLDARYTVFGQVVNGMDVVDRLVPSDVIRNVRVWDGVTP